MKRYVLIAIAVIVFAIPLAEIVPYGIDWVEIYKPKALNMLSGGYDLYSAGYYNPPWIALALIPLAIISPPYDRVAMFIASFIAFFLFAHRMKFHPVSTFFFLVSVPVIASLWDGNIDGFVLLGATLNPAIGMFLVAAKPQIGFVVIIYWLAECFTHPDPLKEIYNRFFYFTCATFASFIVWGFWPRYMFSAESLDWNISIFPYGVVIGLTLTVSAVWYWQKKFAISASPFLSIYTSIQNWSAALVCLKDHPFIMGFVTIGTWVFLLSFL